MVSSFRFSGKQRHDSCVARVAGKTKYPFHRMLLFALTAALSFSPLPVRVSFVLGAGLFAVGGAYALYALARIVFGLYIVSDGHHRDDELRIHLKRS